jgi:hypothetical protein
MFGCAVQTDDGGYQEYDEQGQPLDRDEILPEESGLDDRGPGDDPTSTRCGDPEKNPTPDPWMVVVPSGSNPTPDPWDTSGANASSGSGTGTGSQDPDQDGKQHGLESQN